MKKHSTALCASALVLCLSACASLPANVMPTSDETPAFQNISPPDFTAETMPEEIPENLSGEHIHELSDANNIIEHETVGYCGNTITTVSCQKSSSESWEKSFWGSESVALTDLLRYLDYSEDVCRCMPEYMVNTEFGSDYGLNLTEGYARYDGGQCSLTKAQVEQIREIIDWAATQPDGGLSVNLQSLQPE